MKKINPSVFILLLFAFYACDKMVEIDPPKNQLTQVFTDSADATSTVVGIYVNMMKGLTSLNAGNGAITVYTGFSSDEIYPNTNNASELEFYQNSLSPNNSLNLNLWRFSYALIYQANACIEGLTDNNNLPPGVVNQLMGEAKFMRALLYFYLANLYGDVPLVVSTEFKDNSTLGRTPVAQVYEQIIKDLQEARESLASAYTMNNRVRPNKHAATALLARTYLYLKKWKEAEEMATEVLSKPEYALEQNLNTVFTPASKEVLFQMIPLQAGFETAEGVKFVPASSTAKPNAVITPSLLAAFDNGDKRLQQWLKANTINNQPQYYPYKYKLGNDGNTSPKEYYIVLRLAELYLLRAEARAKQNKLLEGAADLNVTRKRAGLSELSFTDEPALTRAINLERKKELFCEWGHRWLDLKRSNEATQTLSPLKPEWQATDTLYPIPFAEIQTNPALDQNPGY